MTLGGLDARVVGQESQRLTVKVPSAGACNAADDGKGEEQVTDGERKSAQ